MSKIKKTIVLNKKEGETPLEALNTFRLKNREYENVPMTYAGRLDPLASGLLLILTGKEVKKKEKYLTLSKEYEFEILFGFQTDTYDILGKVIKKLRNDFVLKKDDLRERIENGIQYFIGEYNQKYPKYSSKTVKGVPLFVYARSGKEVDIPSKKVLIKQIEFKSIKKISKKVLISNIEKRIKKVKGDFRQKEILAVWKRVLRNNKQKAFYVAKLRINASGGTYVRVIANELGEKIGIPLIAFSIKRTRIGKWCKIEK
ncbi:MAG: hypothetical protein WC898_03395 [Candidatus Paceibacterota bacterium]|jgi:tRNA pseudouridine(55) synthase